MLIYDEPSVFFLFAILGICQVVTSEAYGVYWYKNGSIGIYRRKPKEGEKKQMFSFGAGAGKSEEDMRGLADECLTELDEGKSEVQVRAEAVAKVPFVPSYV